MKLWYDVWLFEAMQVVLSEAMYRVMAEWWEFV